MFSGIFSISATSYSLAIRWTYQHYIFAVEVKNSATVMSLNYNTTAVFLYVVMVSEYEFVEAR